MRVGGEVSHCQSDQLTAKQPVGDEREVDKVRWVGSRHSSPREAGSRCEVKLRTERSDYLGDQS